MCCLIGRIVLRTEIVFFFAFSWPPPTNWKSSIAKIRLDHQQNYELRLTLSIKTWWQPVWLNRLFQRNESLRKKCCNWICDTEIEFSDGMYCEFENDRRIHPLATFMSITIDANFNRHLSVMCAAVADAESGHDIASWYFLSDHNLFGVTIADGLKAIRLIRQIVSRKIKIHFNLS